MTQPSSSSPAHSASGTLLPSLSPNSPVTSSPMSSTAADSSSFRMNSVRARMSDIVYCCGPRDSLAQAAHIMWEKDCGWLPVTDAGGKLIGTITDRDICMAALTRGIRLGDANVESVMSRQVVCAHPEDPIADVEQVMKISQLRRFPVVDGDGHPVGVITLTDLARAESGHGGWGAPSVSGTAAALAEIGEPRRNGPLAA